MKGTEQSRGELSRAKDRGPRNTRGKRTKRMLQRRVSRIISQIGEEQERFVIEARERFWEKGSGQPSQRLQGGQVED